METKQVPTAALRWNSQFELNDNGDDAKSAPFEMRARSGDPVNHWFWGRVVHDFEGMTIAGGRSRVAIDYQHNPDEIIGYANRFDSQSGDLNVSGALIPYGSSDRATEVIHKQKNGVPYEASISFSDPVVEEVEEGQTVQVNGGEFAGPGAVIRQWNLRGIAVCPYGQDCNTETTFSQSEFVEVQVMSKPASENTNTITDCEIITSGALEAAEKFVAVEGGDAVNATVELSVTENVEAESDSDSSTVELSEGERFLQAFGDQGGVWFAQGKSFEEAQVLHTQSIQTALEDSQKENEELKTKLAQLSADAGGEDSPVSFSATEDEVKRKKSITSVYGNK